jgi:periplasmic divalent cation tolerance protein
MQDLEPVVVTTSVDQEKAAREIAERVLEERLAACVHIHPQMTSLYWWKGQITSDSEYLLSMKSDRRLFDRIVATIHLVHPYEVPEIIATDALEVDREYADWMREELNYER